MSLFSDVRLYSGRRCDKAISIRTGQRACLVKPVSKTTGDFNGIWIGWSIVRPGEGQSLIVMLLAPALLLPGILVLASGSSSGREIALGLCAIGFVGLVVWGCSRFISKQLESPTVALRTRNQGEWFDLRLRWASGHTENKTVPRTEVRLKLLKAWWVPSYFHEKTGWCLMLRVRGAALPMVPLVLAQTESEIDQWLRETAPALARLPIDRAQTVALFERGVGQAMTANEIERLCWSVD